MLLPCLNEYETEAGCDEAGRGCIAGPVAAAAVILPAGFSHPLLNDSKQLTHRQRCLMRTVIEKEAAGWAVAMVDSVEIDQINILKASIKAMHLAIDRLTTVPTFLLIDGNCFIKYKKIRHRCIVKGDAIYSSIAAASILAKTHRDEWMDKAHEMYPHYGWNSNRGYPTAIHRKAIEQYGLTPLHRKSFKLTNTQMSINF